MTGPTASEVRKDVLKELNIVKVGKIDFKEKEILFNDTIIEIIPDSRKDFGSWRGYRTFGIKKIIAKEIIIEVRKKYALLT